MKPCSLRSSASPPRRPSLRYGYFRFASIAPFRVAALSPLSDPNRPCLGRARTLAAPPPPTATPQKPLSFRFHFTTAAFFSSFPPPLKHRSTDPPHAPEVGQPSSRSFDPSTAAKDNRHPSTTPPKTHGKRTQTVNHIRVYPLRIEGFIIYDKRGIHDAFHSICSTCPPSASYAPHKAPSPAPIRPPPEFRSL